MIKKKSRVPGVMITQFVEELPEGMSTPDFTRKPIAVTIKEGKPTIFRAIIIGNPTPDVTWFRNNGEIDEDNYIITFDKSSGEHQLQIPNVISDQADTYKCIARNEYGTALVTATLNVIEGQVHCIPEIDEKFWDLLISADKKDYEKICAQYGVTDFRRMLNKLSEKKEEREKEQERKKMQILCNLKPVELRDDGNAEFELEMSLKDPTSKIFLYKVPCMRNDLVKHGLKQVGKKFVFSINGVNPEDAGLYQVVVDGVNIFSTDLKSIIEFLVKIQDVHAEEREDAVFECVVSQPVSKITWMGNSKPLEQGEKFDILVSEDMLIHTLVIKDCFPLDKGIYSANVGMTSCNVGVYFTSGLSDVTAIIGTDAELVCKLNTKDCEGVWYKEDDLCIVKDGTYRKLIVKNCKEEDAGKYKYEADGQIVSCLKTSPYISLDPPRINAEDLEVYEKPVTIKTGKEASFRVSFIGREPMKIQWFHEGEELIEDSHTKIERSNTDTRLVLTKCNRKISGEIKVKIKNECGVAEVITTLLVLDKPTPPLGPVDVIEGSSTLIEFKWRPPKDNGGLPITNYILERQQIGRNSWKKLGKIGPEPKYRDTDVDHGRKYCYHIRAGTKAYPGSPSKPTIVSAFKDCINLAWNAPSNTGGTDLFGYNVEKRKNGSNRWDQVNPPNQFIKVKDVVEGFQYEFRVSAVNISGAGEPSTPSEFVIARDPKKPPGKVIDLKVTDSTYTTLSLGWTKPIEEEGVQDEAKGYFVELRPAEDPEWSRCNSSPIIVTSYTIMGLKSMAMYWVRVMATNEGGDGEAQELDNYIIAMPPPVRPTLTDRKIKNFMIMKAGNSVRVNFNFVASPLPRITWLKDSLPVGKNVTVSNSDTSSQLIIPSAERHDTGIYTLIMKNLAGQESTSVEIRVTDEPKPPGPVDLEENVSGTVTVSWDASPDEKKDDRLHYMITKRDSVKRTWQIVADHLFNNKYTIINIMPGRQYYFRVYAKNDMGESKPSDALPQMDIVESKDCCFETSPTFTVPLKTHRSPDGYECYMSCAVTGDPKPHVTWYRNSISLNTNTNYYITNTCGVCSMVILKVSSKDSGKYSVSAENNLGRVECSTKLMPSD
uniref:Immunoglobulin like and fibronectin type III domain containing 1, tandem duplicate 3 n=1 Tax=Neogobius melanostomus TaxID=47308 RepID=A0A8C6T5L8_9GOBI